MQKENFKLVKLAAEIGLFFAKVDSDYDEKEKNFIIDYIETLKQSNPLSEEEEEEVKKLYSHHLTLEEIIADTNDLLDNFVEEERFPLLNTLSVLINQVINADGVVTKEEAESFALWKKEFNVK